MSHDLVFWREKQSSHYPSATKIYRQVIKTGKSDKFDFEKLPRDEILHNLKKAFKHWNIDLDSATQYGLTSPDFMKSITVEWYGNMAFALCSSSLTSDDLNKIIDIFNEYGCALYDPQINERFAQPE